MTLYTGIQRLLPRAGFVRNVAVLAGGTALGQALGILVSPILTRLYSSSDFGNLALYSSLVSFLIVIVSLRYEMAVLLPEDDETAAEVVCVALCSVVVMTTAFTIGAWIIWRWIPLHGSYAALRPFLWLVPISTLGAGCYQTLNYWALRRKDFRRVAVTKVTQIAYQAVFQLIAGFWRGGLAGLLIGDAIGRAGGTETLARGLRRHDMHLFRTVTRRGIQRAAARYRHFPIYSSWSALLNTSGPMIAPVLIGGWYGSHVLGMYALQNRVTSAPMLLIGQGVSQVYMSESARLAATDPVALMALFDKSVKRLLMIAVAIMAVLLPIAPPLFGFVFGASWREAGVFAQLLVPFYISAFVSWPLSGTLNVLEKQAWQFGWDASRLVLILGSLCLANALHWSSRYSIMTFGVVMTFTAMAHLCLSRAAIAQRIRDHKAVVV